MRDIKDTQPPTSIISQHGDFINTKNDPAVLQASGNMSPLCGALIALLILAFTGLCVLILFGIG